MEREAGENPGPDHMCALMEAKVLERRKSTWGVQ